MPSIRKSDVGSRHVSGSMSHSGMSHDRHAGHSVAMFRDKFWLSLALTIPTVIWSSEVQHWLGYSAPSFRGSTFIPAILGTIVFFYGGLVFIRGARRELAERKPGMMTLISFGHHCCVCYFSRRDIRPVRDRSVVGACVADYDHGSRPLAGNASDFSSSWRARCPGRLASGYC